MPQKFHKEVEAEMRELIGGERCMRAILDEAMDGREDRIGCEEGEERCQRCQGLVEEWEDSRILEDEVLGSTPAAQVHEDRQRTEFEQQLLGRRVQEVEEAGRQAMEAVEVEELVELMEEWKDGCQRCRAWDVQGKDHRIWDCQREGAEEIRQGVEAFSRLKRWAAYSCCFECGLPQAVCQSFKVDISTGGHRKQGGVGCQYAGVLVETVMAIWVRYTQEFGDMVEAAMKKDGWVERTAEEREEGPGMGEVARWFGEKKMWGGIEGNKISWFIGQVVRQVGK